VQARSTRVARVSLKPFPLHQIDERVSFEISPFGKVARLGGSSETR